VVTWSDSLGDPVAAALALTRRRPGHVAILLRPFDRTTGSPLRRRLKAVTPPLRDLCARSRLVVVPPGDPAAMRAAIAELWAHPERCARMGADGRRRVERGFPLEDWAATLGRLMHEAARRR
jgi:glycosyltransferase involved in cell wall biosynthesis